ncbi:hypothetical protein GP475_10360 [Corynebacterium poyangense]|uniref:Uncharacterized protein n=1 Tax=Corynebacterium poyangense TaxID=2684405 RepID=A0A7H0SR14_9CORY|nr:hypothetical protein [Corynebacterium poyangense]MBZ8176409.1 hypothetical protein [Corynebacterium poyangense]QNQ90989.1 hypothetical protein GP475_10360 [Corynebacterium poyangense]
MSTVQKYFAPAICVATLLAASQSTPVTAAEPAVADVHNSQDVITVQENGEISSVESPSPHVQLRSAGERAPDCINATPEKGFVQVYNHCNWDIHVKVIFAFAPDSGCKLVVAGTRTNISPHIGRIDGVETC